MSNKKYQSIMVKVDDKITKCVLSRTFPLHIDFPFVLYYYSKNEKKCNVKQRLCAATFCEGAVRQSKEKKR